MIRWAVLVVAGLALVVVIVAVIGWRLPKAHTASRTVRIPMTPDALYALLSDVSQYQRWRADVKSLQRLPDKDGRPAWIEEVGGMKIPMRFERMERPALLVGRIDTHDLPFGGTWTYRITQADGGSDLSITEDGEVYNPIFRFMSRFVFGYYATMDGFIKNLQTVATKR